MSFTIFDSLRGWEWSSACTVRISVPICLKFGVQNLHWIWLVRYEFRANRAVKAAVRWHQLLSTYIIPFGVKSDTEDLRPLLLAIMSLWTYAQARPYFCCGCKWSYQFIYLCTLKSCGHVGTPWYTHGMCLLEWRASCLHFTALCVCVCVCACACVRLIVRRNSTLSNLSSTVQTLVTECLMWVFRLTWQC